MLPDWKVFWAPWRCLFESEWSWLYWGEWKLQGVGNRFGGSGAAFRHDVGSGVRAQSFKLADWRHSCVSLLVGSSERCVNEWLTKTDMYWFDMLEKLLVNQQSVMARTCSHIRLKYLGLVRGLEKRSEQTLEWLLRVRDREVLRQSSTCRPLIEYNAPSN